MDMLNGFMDALQLTNILYVFAGVALGVVTGGVPGLSGPIAIAMVIPLTYFMPAIGAIGFLVGINKGGAFGGSIASILINTPGAPEAAATAFDGYPMAQQGKSSKALKVALLSSTFGDLFSTCLIILVAGAIAKVALHLGPPEITALLIAALVLIAMLESESFITGIIAICFGLLFSTVGMEPVAALPRFDFGLYNLESGIPIATLAIGTLAVAELVRQFIVLRKQGEHAHIGINYGDKEANKLTLRELLSLLPTLIRSSIIGSIIGACPGLGATVAGFLGYGVAKKAAKPWEKFGEGEIKGVAAPEAANNAVIGAALIPLFTLGIPGNVASSLMVGAFVIHGITLGPLMFEEHARSVYGIYGSMLVGNIAVLILGYIIMRMFVKILDLPKRTLYSAILLVCITGSFVIEGEAFYVHLMILFFIIGFFLRVAKLSYVGFLIGFILGKTFEMSLQQTIIMSNNNLLILFQRPFSCAIMILTILYIAYNGYLFLKKLQYSYKR